MIRKEKRNKIKYIYEIMYGAWFGAIDALRHRCLAKRWVWQIPEWEKKCKKKRSPRMLKCSRLKRKMEFSCLSFRHQSITQNIGYCFALFRFIRWTDGLLLSWQLFCYFSCWCHPTGSSFRLHNIIEFIFSFTSSRYSFHCLARYQAKSPILLRPKLYSSAKSDYGLNTHGSIKIHLMLLIILKEKKHALYPCSVQHLTKSVFSRRSALQRKTKTQFNFRPLTTVWMICCIWSYQMKC